MRSSAEIGDSVVNDFESCYRAVTSKDARFDGWFVTAVTSTGIYCRPSCPAVTPKRTNVRFLGSAAAAQQAGFRACLRCRPDAAPGSPWWSYRGDAAARAMRLIGDGVVDREGVSGLAHRIGYTPRHLARVLHAEVGAATLALARAQRAHTARILIETTSLGLADIAFAAGFGSVRQFNDTMRQVYGRAPSALRQAAGPSATVPATQSQTTSGAPPARPGPVVLRVRLPFRQPLHRQSLLDFLAARAIDGVEEVAGTSYRRILRMPYGLTKIDLNICDDHVDASLRLADLRDLSPTVARCRRLLDLDADPTAVDAMLGADPIFAEAVAAEPGVRVPGAVDGFEIAVRAVVGQQVSVASARAVLATLARPESGDAPPTEYPFPSPEDVCRAPDRAFAMPASRRRTLRALAEAVGTGAIDLDPGADRQEAVVRLCEVPGIGPWTAQYVALRALGDPDIFPANDVALRRAAAERGLDARWPALSAHAQRHWAPWRSYATIRLWRMA